MEVAIEAPEHATSLRDLDVALLVTDGVEEIEYLHPRSFLEKRGAVVTTISPKPESETVQTYNKSDPAGQFRVELDLRNAQPSEFDALIIPGGVCGPVKLRITRSAVEFIQSFGEQQRTIAAICHGPGALIETGLIRGKRVTSRPSLRGALEQAGAQWIDAPVVIDGNLITAQSPDDLPQFEHALIEQLAVSRRGDRRET